MLTIGMAAPNVKVPDGEGRLSLLKKVATKGPLVIFFYPKDFTPGCVKQACMLRDLHGELAAQGIRVLGVSHQDEASHARFRAAHDLPFELIADVDRRLIKAFEVEGPFGLVRRTTYLVDREGRIADAVRADFRIDRHEAFVRRAIAAAAEGRGADRPSSGR
ncbi:MAG: peroxiredoxin [Planctomycetota bacterium]